MEVSGTWKDHFTAHSAEYSRFRPTYPLALFEQLAELAPARRLAWDCGTGNGQAATGLANVFEHVIATDASGEQITHAVANPRVEYRVAAAEDPGLEDASVDLVTVAQAVHWFDLDAFYAQVRRVARPQGVLALWCYELTEIDPAVDECVRRFYYDVVGPYWPKERVHVENGYRDLPFPFAEITMPAVAMETEWSLGHLLGYVDTWSPVRIYRREQGRDPLDELGPRLAEAWGDPQRVRRARFPLRFRVGRVLGSCCARLRPGPAGPRTRI
jgi:SAM-dependent methyltransferase